MKSFYLISINKDRSNLQRTVVHSHQNFSIKIIITYIPFNGSIWYTAEVSG